jgi:protein O-GlcNAc transferase
VTVKRVLLTGASGFLGRQTIGPLLDLSWEVHAVGSTVTDPRARWYRADLLDQTARRQLLTAVRPDALLHCAWVAQPVVYLTSPANLDWVAASLDLARLARERGATRMLMVGSCAEYDWHGLPARPWREDDHCQPTSLYGTAKHALRNLMTAFAAQIDIGLVWARLFHLYGPDEASARLVPSLLAALREGRRAETGPAEAVRDFMHVADAGRALVHLLAGETRGVVNVASGEPVKVGTIARIAAQIAGRPDLQAVPTKPSVGHPNIMLANTAKLRSTGFTPSIALDQGILALWQGTEVQKPASDPPRKATKQAPLELNANYDIAARLYRAGRLDEARAAAERVLAAEPDHHRALNLVGVLHRLRGDFARARTCLERAAALDPDNETAWINLGNVHLDMEAAEAAVDAYTRALNAAPGRSDTLRLLGNALARAGRDVEAVARLDEAVASAVPGALRDRARAHFSAGHLDRAIADLDTALVEAPQDVELRLIKAQMLRLSGHAKDAAALLRELLAFAPDSVDVHLSLADALLAEERRETANEHYARAVALRPDDTTEGKYCWSLLNSRYGSEAAHVGEAVATARRMVARGVLHPSAAHSVQSALLRVADLDTLAAFDRLFPDRRVLLDYWVRRNVVGALHAQLARVGTLDDRLTLVDCHRQWGERYEAKVKPLRTRASLPGTRIRVGFVSSDLRHHPVSYFALPIFDHYDRSRFEFYAYSFNPAEPDAVQRRIASRIAAFRRMPNLPERDIAERIAADKLDVLFELGGSTHLNRLEVMAHQPAPVQVSWLGYPHSSGLSRIGYILIDPYLKPPDPRMLLEQPFEMPSSWVCLGPLGFANQPIEPRLPEERFGRLTFGTMNNPYKYSPDAIALWARVLHRVPESRFLMVRPEAGVPLFRENMGRAFARHGITEDRLSYVAVRGKHMAHYNQIDIALDSLPQTGGTTTCEALWMGVPTVSLVGPAFFERLSFSNLTNAGLRDLAVDTPDAYVDMAVSLAADRDRRRALRHGLRDSMRAAPIGDTVRWVRDFEALTVRTFESTVAATDAAA